MKTILAIESGGEYFSAALLADDKTLCNSAASPHSQFALPLVQRLLAEAGLTLQQCDAFAFAAGPGRFSGLRMACGMVQAFAYTTMRPGVQVGSFAALAEANYGADISECAAAYHAYRGHVYAAHCRRKHCWHAAQPQLLPIADYAMPSVSHACGDAFVNHFSDLTTDVQIKNEVADAAAVAKVAAVMYDEGDVVDAVNCQPLYIRKQVAKTIAERARA